MDTIEHTNSPHHSLRAMRISSPTFMRTDIITASEEPENRNGMEPLPATLRPSSPHMASSVNNTAPEILERDDNGQTPLHRAAENGNKELVELLLAHGAEKEPRDYKKQIPLHLAASSGGFETAVALLGPGKDTRDKYGQTPMHIAASKGNNEVVELLIDEKANKEALDNSNHTPLHLAAKYGKTEAVRVLVQKGANKGAKDVNDKNPLHLALDRATALILIDSNVSTPPPQTATQYQIYIRQIISDRYSKFFNPDEPSVKILALKASTQAKDAVSEFRLPANTVPGLVKLALHDFVILCDDSSSMQTGPRIPVLKDTLRRVARFATYLTPTGISLRFLNRPTDPTFNDLSSVEKIMNKIENIEFSGSTKLGTELDEQVVKPLIKKAEQREFRRPLFVVIITDGEPTDEDPNTLRDTILKCKKSPAIKDYGDTAVVFLISQVGDNATATTFLRELQNNASLEGMVYSSTERLDELRAKFEAQNDDRRYTAWLIELFLAALEKHK